MHLGCALRGAGAAGLLLLAVGCGGNSSQSEATPLTCKQVLGPRGPVLTRDASREIVEQHGLSFGKDSGAIAAGAVTACIEDSRTDDPMHRAYEQYAASR